MKVKNYIELQKAVDGGEKEIILTKSIASPNSIRLKRGQKISGEGEVIMLSFINSEGLILEGDNDVSNLIIQTSQEKRAISLSSSLEDLGVISLKNLTVNGVVQILTRNSNKKLDVKINNLDIPTADARGYSEKPQKYGVNVYQGALTIYNYNPDESSLITVDAENVSIGREKSPALGSGIFIAGFNDDGGKTEVKRLVTGDIYSNGMIPFGQPNLITGGIFILNSAHAEEIITDGKTVTYGVNDMVLDVWGKVDKWVINEKIVSHGSSGIGFVNFGTVDYFEARKPIETYGLGARGFNQYDGTIKEAKFDKIETFADGSIGMQFSKPVGKIVVEKDVITNGGNGETLVKGEIMTLAADGISVKEGGEIKELVVKGNIETNGDSVKSLHVDGGKIEKIEIGGEIIAEGKDSEKVVGIEI